MSTRQKNVLRLYDLGMFVEDIQDQTGIDRDLIVTWIALYRDSDEWDLEMEMD